MAKLGRVHEEVMPIIKAERTLFRVGENSYAVTLPKSWIVYKGLKYGDVVEVIANDDVIVRAKPPKETVDAEVNTSVIP